uniref:Putative nucleic-acid-binding protein from transposon x-element n=1 Tax=Lutzomyia longipalpis TaxID=7200 RepID=A0A1B0CG00_LUTLO
MSVPAGHQCQPLRVIHPPRVQYHPVRHMHAVGETQSQVPNPQNYQSSLNPSTPSTHCTSSAHGLEHVAGISPAHTTDAGEDTPMISMQDHIMDAGDDTPKNSTQAQDSSSRQREIKPPPIYVHGVVDIKPLQELLVKHTSEGYTLKSMKGNEVKIQVNTAEHYRAIMKELKERKADLHSYQFKNERSFRVVLKNLHQTTSPEDIKEELMKLGHKVKHITNIRDRATKTPIPMFYIDLQQNTNNKDIYSINRFMHTVVPSVRTFKPNRAIVSVPIISGRNSLYATNCSSATTMRFASTKSKSSDQEQECESYLKANAAWLYLSTKLWILTEGK